MQRIQLPPEEMLKKWKTYKRAPTPEMRNFLMEYFLPIVKYNADRISIKLPDEVEVDDLISAGIFGLMDAIESYDLDRGVKFETYCAPRIRGAILDELRMMDWVPRLVRSRAHRLDHVKRILEAELGRDPTHEELADRMKLSKPEFDRLIRDATATGLVSLSRKFYETDSSKDFREIDVLQDKRGEDPVSEAEKNDLKELMKSGLTRSERLILILYYYEQMTMKEIGATLDLSESRVSQMHSAILNRLRGRLSKHRREIA